MVDRKDQLPIAPAGAAGSLSAEEADRLSEKFRPSWETETSDPAPVAEPRKLAKQTLIGGISPFAADPPAGGTSGSSPPPAKPTSDAPQRPAAKQTLMGMAPVGSKPSDPAPAQPTKSQPAAPAVVTAGGSSDGPSGIAKPYRPKDDPSSPAVVLTEDLQRTEAAAATAEAEARRRTQTSRHMQTVMNIRAPDFPTALAKKKKNGLWQLGLGVLAGVVVVSAVFKLTSQEPAPAAAGIPAAEPEALSAPAPVAATSEAVTTAAPSVVPAEPAANDAVESGATSGQTSAARAPARTKPAAAAKKASTKVATPVAKEPAASSPSPAKKSGVIVRDSPF
jgi:hypothetical protein